MRLSDEHLAEAVCAAFEALPEPDATRLKQVEERLVRRAARPAREKKLRIGYWWLIAALAASGAAAWWGGEFFSRRSSERGLEQYNRSMTEILGREEFAKGLSRPEEEKSPPTGSTSESRKAQTIYRKENY